jgi:hypothetical protein
MGVGRQWLGLTAIIGQRSTWAELEEVVARPEDGLRQLPTVKYSWWMKVDTIGLLQGHSSW